MTTFPFEDRAAILELEQQYWRLSTSAERVVEEEIERSMPAARQRGFLTKDLFVLVSRWKSKRNTPHYERNTAGNVEATSRVAFEAATEAEAIGSLTRLHGVQLRTATALLHWMRPDEFPILDFRVVGALGDADPPRFESTAYYSGVATRVRALGTKHAITLRTLDRALWAWQKLEARNIRRLHNACTPCEFPVGDLAEKGANLGDPGTG